MIDKCLKTKEQHKGLMTKAKPRNGTEGERRKAKSDGEEQGESLTCLKF
jgi:hypothetical protein